MSGDRPLIPNRDDPGFRDLREPDAHGRAMFAPHRIIDKGVERTVFPAIEMTFGSIRSVGSDEYVPTIRIDMAGDGFSLVFAPNVSELRALAKEFIETADRMEGEAAALLEKALGKRGNA